MKLLCDEMLARLGRWLRAAGYDTLIAGGMGDDRTLLETAMAEDRVVLTRDRELAARRQARGRVVVLASEGIPAQVRELKRRLGIDWLREPFTRCVVDNTPLRDASADETQALPPKVRGRGGPFTACPTCGRLYWQGGHHRRMRIRLESWRRAEDRL